MNRQIAETTLNVLIGKLNTCNIYMHHIWGNEFDTEDEIRSYVLSGGIKVKYGRSMFSTLKPFENPTAEDLLDYYFANKFKKMHTVIVAIPKETLICGTLAPFSNHLIKFDDSNNQVMNQKYLSPFDAVRSISVNKYIPKEFVFGAIDIDGDEINIELNPSFSPDKGVEKYVQKIVDFFEIDGNDDLDAMNSKFVLKLDEMNLDAGESDFSSDISVDLEP